MRQMSGKKRVVMTGISSLLVAGLVVGNIEYATHTYRYDSKVQAMAANNKVVEQTASFASSKKKSTVSKEETVYATLDANGGVTDRKRFQYVHQFFAQKRICGHIVGIFRRFILNEIAKICVVRISHRALEGNRLLGHFHYGLDTLHGEIHFSRNFIRGRLVSKLLQ